MIERTVRNNEGTPMDALAKVNRARAKSGVEEAARSTVYRFIAGATHVRGKKGTRGREPTLTRADVRTLDQTRKRLLKEADSERRITWETIQEEAGLGDRCCSKTVHKRLRSEGVRFRPPRSKVQLTEDDAKKRLKVAKEWVKFPATFWSKKVHAYVDNKAWPLPLSPKQKKTVAAIAGDGASPQKL